ncbi:hypothetical protein [Absidia glauca]|uniref:Uncharacterized protein n=1 Tax=Absidia glauca TaxID=4829 RepID=A0A163M6Y1_ABSGL|nr:hypothetical protein [Absidia glauca]
MWPLIDLVSDVVGKLACTFKVGETLLESIASLPMPLPAYSADGSVSVKGSRLEILLFEASGPFKTRDRPRHTYDHIKGAYGCYSMINAILSKYPHADQDAMDDLSALFLHTSAKGKLLFITLYTTKIGPALFILACQMLKLGF